MSPGRYPSGQVFLSHFSFKGRNLKGLAQNLHVCCLTPPGVCNLSVILEVTWRPGIYSQMPLQQLSRHENYCSYSPRLVYKDCSTESSLAGDYHRNVCNTKAGKISGCCITVCQITQGCTTEAAGALWSLTET